MDLSLFQITSCTIHLQCSGKIRHAFFLLCWVGVHCGIYKSSYNVSNLSYFNSPPPPFSFISLPPFLEWFQQVSLLHLHTCVHIFCSMFTLLPPFPATSPFLLWAWYQPHAPRPKHSFLKTQPSQW
jgi:hypothetical protein